MGQHHSKKEKYIEPPDPEYSMPIAYYLVKLQVGSKPPEQIAKFEHVKQANAYAKDYFIVRRQRFETKTHDSLCLRFEGTGGFNVVTWVEMSK